MDILMLYKGDVSKDQIPSEGEVMNKKMIAVALILLVAIGGLFAAPTIPDPVSVRLMSTVGEFLTHGFTNSSGTKYQATLPDIENAFSVTPSFTYGYRTNSLVGLKFSMIVSPFINQTDSSKKVSIASVKKGSESLTPSSGDYTLFTRAGSGDVSSVEATFSIYPSDSDITDAPQGTYISTVSISVATM